MDEDLFPYLSRLSIVRRNPLSWALFLAQCNPEKRKVYAKAVEDLETKPLCERDLVRKVMTKTEKYIKSTDPRVIQYVNARATVSWLRFIQAIEKPIYVSLDDMFGEPTVMKGKNLDDMGQCIMDGWNWHADPVGYSTDMSRFDQHVRDHAHVFCHIVYRMFLNLNKLDSAVFEAYAASQLGAKVRGRVWDIIFEYETNGQLFSGDGDTSLKAILIVLFLWFKFFLDHAMTPRRDYSLRNMGDDNLAILPALRTGVMDDVERWFAQYGFINRVDGVVTSPLRIRFCQVFPIYDENRDCWTCCRDPVAVMKKDVVSCQANNPDWEDNFHSIAVGGLAMFGNMPILGAFYRAMLRAFPRGLCNKKYLPWNLRYFGSWASRGMQPTERMRSDFAIATGIPTSVQIEMENTFGKWEAPSGVTTAERARVWGSYTLDGVVRELPAQNSRQ